MATVKLKRGLKSKVPSLPKEDGSLIFGYTIPSAPATMQLDQNIGGTVQRLNLFVANSGTSNYSKNSEALGGSSLSQILESFNSGSVSADSATRIVPSIRSIANNFTIRTGIPTSSGWNQHPAYHLCNTTKPELTSYKGKNVSLLHMDGGAQRHDIVALNSANDGLLYATASSADGSARIERILDGGNYGSLITNLSKQVTFSNGLKVQTNVQMDGGNFSTGSTVTTGNGEATISNIKIKVEGDTLIITTK